MDSFLIHMINDECKLRGKAFCEKLLLKVTECMKEMSDDSENVEDIPKLIDHEPVKDSENVDEVEEVEESDDEESDDEESDDEVEESHEDSPKDKIYKYKSTEWRNDSVYTIKYNAKDEHYTCTCPDFKYHCSANNMMCKHIEKINELDDKANADNIDYITNGITIVQ